MVATVSPIPLEPIDIGDVPVEEIVKTAVERGVFFFDLETTGLSPRRDRIEGIAIYVPPVNIIDEIGLLWNKEDGRTAVRKGKALKAWIPFVPDTMRVLCRTTDDPNERSSYVNLRPPLPQVEAMEKLRPLFEDHPEVVGIAHNVKFDSAFLIHSPGTDKPFKMNLRLACSMLLDFLGDENQKQYGLKNRVKLLLGHEMTTYDDVSKYRHQLTLPFMAGKVKPIGAYAMEDTTWGYQLFETGLRRIMDEDDTGRLERIYWRIDMEVCRTVEEMESAGVLIDWRWLRKVSSKLEDQKDEVLTRIENRLGYVLNPKSAPQVSNLLFGPKEGGFLGLSTKVVPFKEKGGHYATGSKEIGHLKRADPLVADILKWRSLDTVQSSFSIKIADLVLSDPEGRLHAKFNQNGTQIFRFSCVREGTPVEILRDVAKFPHGVPIQDVKSGDWAYTYDDNLKLTLRQIKKVWKTGTREVVRVHWKRQGHGKTTHGYLDVTPEHPIRRVDGSYARADSLRDGDRVLALSRHMVHDYAGLYATRHGHIPSEHRFVYEIMTGRCIPRDCVVHHLDRNKLNNRFENLELRTRSSHKSEHATEQWNNLNDVEKAASIANLTKSWKDPKRKRRHRTQLQRMWKEGKFHKPQGTRHPPYEEITVGWLSEKVAERGSLSAVRTAYGMNYYRLVAVAEKLGFVPGNHVITKVEAVEGCVNVYDLEIEGTHNFIAGELCVHNSSDPVNFQNQPRDRKLIRKAFVGHLPEEVEEIKKIINDAERKQREDGLMLLFGADYSQIELRVAAHLSGDKNMIEVYSMVGGCKADDGLPCARFHIWVCDDCDKEKRPEKFTPPLGVVPTNCPKCNSTHIEHQKRCRHVDIHQRTAEDVDVPRNPLAKCLDGSTLVRTVNGVKTISSLIPISGAPGEHQALKVCLTDGRGGYVHSSSAIYRHDRPTKIVVTKRAVVIATEDHRFQVIGDYDALDPSTPGYKHVPGLSLVEARNLEKGMKLPVAEMGEEGRNQDHAWHDFSDPQSVRLNPFTKEIGDGPAEIVLNEDWAYFAGMFHGDGCASGNACVITHGHTDEYEPWRQIVRSACDKLGLPTTVTSDKRNTRIGSRIVRRYFAALGLCREEGKSGVKTMCVPWWVLDGGPKIIWSYLAGLFDTDGTVGKKTSGTVSVTMKSPEYAGQVAFLLRELGMPVLVQPQFNKTYERWYYTIHVLGEGLERFQRYCPMRHPDKRVRLTERNEAIKRRCAPSDDEVMLVLDGGERTVYDFNVENEDHLYLQGGLLGHNNLNFGSLYRIGPERFCQYADLYDEKGEPRIEYAREVLDGWFAAYPSIKPFHYATEAYLREHNWVAQTITGRRHRLSQARMLNEYEAITKGIQFQVSGCLAAGAMVLAEDGYRAIETLDPSRHPIFDGARFTGDYRVHTTGVKETFDIELDGGRRLRASSQHRFAVMDGLQLVWKSLGELRPGDVIATSDRLAPGGDQDYGASDAQAYLVGALIGDGYYGASQGFVLAASARDPGWPEALEAVVVEALGADVRGRLRWGLRRTSLGGNVRDLIVHSAAARNKLAVLGLDCVSKLAKRIPSWVATSAPATRGAVLAGLIDTDGHVGLYKQNGYTQLVVQYSSRVRELVQGAWELASSLGIEAHITEHEVMSTSKCPRLVKQFRLNIGYRGFQAFHRWVRLRHPRKAAQLEAGLAVIGRAPARRSLPISFVKAVAELAGKSAALATRRGSSVAAEDRAIRRQVQTYIGHARTGAAGENMVRAILDYIEEPGPKEVLDLGWKAIRSITAAGERPTYDIEINGPNHAYVAGGFLTHNSAQDILKLAMIAIVRERQKKIDEARSPEIRALWKKFRFLIQVHDEIICEGPHVLRYEIKEIIERCMKGAAKLRVPLESTAKFGASWDDIH